MIRLLALSSLLVLLPLPLSSLNALAAQTQSEKGEEGETGMAARPYFVVEAGVRVPTATSASVASRGLLPVALTTAPPTPTAGGWLVVDPTAPRAPTVRLTLLGRLLLDGG